MEDAFEVPESWVRKAEPFRGLRPAPKVAIVPEQFRSRVAEFRERTADRVREAFQDPQSDPGLVRRAELHRGTSSGVLRRRPVQQDDPLGAAVLLAAIGDRLTFQERASAGPLLIDDLVHSHGIPFAAETAALATDVTSTPGVQRRRTPPYRDDLWHSPLITGLGRMRALLAAASDADHAEATARLAALRSGPPLVRLVTSYLVPTEQGWVHDAVAELSTWHVPQSLPQFLLVSVTTREDADAVLAGMTPWMLRHRDNAIVTLAANVGPDITDTFVQRLDTDLDVTSAKDLLEVLGVLPTDAAMTALVERVDRKHVQPALLEAMRRYPVRAARILAAHQAGTGAATQIRRTLLRGHALSHPELTGQAEALGAQTVTLLEEIRAAATAVLAASPEVLPAVLVSPPWTRKRKRAKPPTVSGLTPPPGLGVRWAPGEEDAWTQPAVISDPAKAAADLRKAVTDRSYGYYALQLLAIVSTADAEPYLRTYTPARLWFGPEALKRIVGRHGRLGAEFALRIAPLRPTTMAPALLPLVSTDVARLMAGWLGSKSLRSLARTWLERHGEAGAEHLIPDALGKAGKARSTAEAALRMIEQAGHRELVMAAAKRYGPEAEAAVQGVLDADPLDRLPARVPAHPAWLDPAFLPQVLLRDRATALPAESVGHVCTMLALCKPGDTYAGIDLVKRAVDPASLAELAWAIFTAWQSAEYPSKDGWVFEALGLLGDDDTVRQLTPLIRAWPGEGGHARATAALEVLAAIGTDVALMHLHGIAEKARFKGLKTNAQEKIDQVADGLGLTPEQLADRLVPGFGLDEKGELVLDYGPRRFVIGFDEALKPVISDEDGSRRKTLPKPAAKDDEHLAPAAYKTFSGLKKDVKTVAADQIRRLERAMVASRRWTTTEHRTLFVEHPLLWHLSRRLVWATFDDNGAPTAAFRVAEDRTFADVEDDELTLPENATVGIAHPLHLGDQVAAWSEVFTDYEILQPFPQLGRATHELTGDEQQATVLHRLDGITIDVGRILGLNHRGWERGAVMDAGMSNVYCKPVPGDRVIVLDLDPGIAAGMATEFKEQKVDGVWVTTGSPDFGNSKGNRPFSELDAITVSELLRDLEHLRG